MTGARQSVNPVLAKCNLADRVGQEERIISGVQFQRQASFFGVIRRQQNKAQEHEHSHQSVCKET